MNVGLPAATQAVQMDDLSVRVIVDADDNNQHPEVTALPQERDPDDNEHPIPTLDPNRKWSPLTSFWNEMGDDKPPVKKRKVGTGQSEDEFDELEEEDPNGIIQTSGLMPRLKSSEGSQSPLDGDSAITLNAGNGSTSIKRECTRCIRSGTPCVVGTGASCMRCRAMHQSCSLVAGRSTQGEGKEPTTKTHKSEARAANGVSLRRRQTANNQGGPEDLLDDVLDNMNGTSTLPSTSKKRRRSDEPPTTIGSRSQTPDFTNYDTGKRDRSPDVDEIIEQAAASAGQLGPTGSSVLPRTRKRSLNHINNHPATHNQNASSSSLPQRTPRKTNHSENVRPNGSDSHSRSQLPSRLMKALLMSSRAGRLYSEAIEELSLFIEEQNYL